MKPQATPDQDPPGDAGAPPLIRINCVDWARADAYYRSQGARLPSELEWEYAARGGANYYPFSWGCEAADERACWNSTQTFPVGSYAPGAFGLHDMSGNVWEWTNDWFGEYPWPRLSGRAKVLRGGGWNRRSDRSLATTLRNRASPYRSGAYPSAMPLRTRSQATAACVALTLPRSATPKAIWPTSFPRAPAHPSTTPPAGSANPAARTLTSSEAAPIRTATVMAKSYAAEIATPAPAGPPSAARSDRARLERRHAGGAGAWTMALVHVSLEMAVRGPSRQREARSRFTSHEEDLSCLSHERKPSPFACPRTRSRCCAPWPKRRACPSPTSCGNTYDASTTSSFSEARPDERCEGRADEHGAAKLAPSVEHCPTGPRTGTVEHDRGR
jgi:Sulfatase-modifying factor enzyme 1